MILDTNAVSALAERLVLSFVTVAEFDFVDGMRRVEW